MADQAVSGYQDWLNNNGPQRLSDSISDFANSAYGAGTEMAQALSDMLNDFFDNVTNAMDAALDAYLTGAESIGDALAPYIMAMRDFLRESPLWRALTDVLNPAPNDPLVLDLNGDGGLGLIALADSKVHVDFDGNGYAEKTGWVAPQDGLLAIDRDGNGKIDAATDLLGGARDNGFTVLKLLDSNGDNKISSADAQFANLRVWQDLNSNGVAEAGEVKTLAQWNIKEISLATTALPVQQVEGQNAISATATITKTDGTTSKIGSAIFAADKLLSTWTPPAGFTSSYEADKLPDLKGYGSIKDLSAAMTLDPALLAKVQAFVVNCETMSGAQLRASFEDILLTWTGASAASPTGRGEYVDGQHLQVIERFYDGDYVDTLRNGTTSADPNYTNGPWLEGIFQNMLTSMMTQFMGQIAWSKAQISGNPDDFTASKFWPLTLIGNAATPDTFALVVDLLKDQAPADVTAAQHYYAAMGVALAGSSVNVFGQDWEAYKSALADAFADIPDTKILMLAVTDKLVPGATLLEGTDGADVLTGLSTPDTILGYGGDDTIHGLSSDDVFIGGRGDDVMYGDLGNDTYIYNVGDGNDTVAEIGLWAGQSDRLVFGNGLNVSDLRIDRHFSQGEIDGGLVLTFSGYSGSVTALRQDDGAYRGVELFQFADGTVWTADQMDEAWIAQELALGKTSITGFWNRDDVITGSWRNETFDGAAGSDTILGAGGDDVLLGDDGSDVLDGGSGNDILIGGKHNDVLNGGSGIDTADYNYSWIGIKANLSTAAVTLGGSSVAAGTVLDGASYIDTLISIENINGTSHADYITGSAAANTLIGGKGDDTLDGANGADTLWGGGGNDTLMGGNEPDTIVYSDSTSAVYVNLRSTSQVVNGQTVAGYRALDGLGGTDTLSGIQNVTGSQTASTNVWGGTDDNIITTFAGADWVNADAGNDTISAGAGNDTIDGGTGTDTADYSTSTAGIKVNLSTAAVTLGGTSVAAGKALDGLGGTDTLLNIENIKGSSYDDFVIGSTSANTLIGGNGNDTLDGANGADTLWGGAGNDTLIGGNEADTIVYSDSTSAVYINLRSTSQVVNGQTVAGYRALDGLGGTDTLSGIQNVTGSQTTSTNVWGGTDNNVITTFAGADWVNGDGGDDTINTGNGNDVVDGGAGNDLLVGGAGSDTLNGNTGTDTADYSTSTAGIKVNLSAATATLGGTSVAAGKALDGLGGTDTLSNIENINGSAYADFILGSTLANVLNGGAGNDVLTGGAGNDIFVWATGGGSDTITDFQDGADLLRLSGTGASFASLAISNTAAGAQVALAGATLFTLNGILASQLQAADFAFV